MAPVPPGQRPSETPALQLVSRDFFAAPLEAEKAAAAKKEFLQRVRKLQLGEEQLAFEFSGRLRSPALLGALAKANAVPFTRETNKDRLIEMITHYARRAYAKVSE